MDESLPDNGELRERERAGQRGRSGGKDRRQQLLSEVHKANLHFDETTQSILETCDLRRLEVVSRTSAHSAQPAFVLSFSALREGPSL